MTVPCEQAVMPDLQIHTRTQRGAMLAVGRAAFVTPEGARLGSREKKSMVNR